MTSMAKGPYRDYSMEELSSLKQLMDECRPKLNIKKFTTTPKSYQKLADEINKIQFSKVDTVGAQYLRDIYKNNKSVSAKSIELIDGIKAGLYKILSGEDFEKQQQIADQNFLSETKSLLFINRLFWEKIRKRAKALEGNLDRYYTRIDSSLIPEAVALEEIVPPKDAFTVYDADGADDRKAINQVLDLAASQPSALIKVLAEGGVGKSTFMYWLAEKYCNTYNTCIVKKISEPAVDDSISFIKSVNSTLKPCLILIDDIARLETSEYQAEDFIGEIKDRINFSDRVIFMLFERETRYSQKFHKNEIERLFSRNVQYLSYAPPSKEELFDKLYERLAKDNAGLSDEQVQQEAKAIFLDNSIASISESTFRLLFTFKVQNRIKDYEFDWVEWDNLVKDSEQFRNLRYLFLAVATFYQFGIQLPITFKSSHLTGVNRLDIIAAIKGFGTVKSPIRLSDDNQFLSLKHEFVADWYLHDHGRLAQGFFRDFLNEVDNEDSARLLRKLRKIMISDEFSKSCLAGELDEKNYHSIADRYLSSPLISFDEREKMLNEKGMLYRLANDIDKAKFYFNKIADDNPNNKHARDQLAKIYITLSEYQKALDKYIEIYNSGGLYALAQIYRLLRLTRRKNIELNYQIDTTGELENILISDVSDYVRHNLINELIAIGEFAAAEDFLSKIGHPTEQTARYYLRLANGLKLSPENIQKKRELFGIAMDLHKKVSGKDNHQFTIDYAVFLFSIRRFSESTAVIKQIGGAASPEARNTLETLYRERIRSIPRLVFEDIPSEENLMKREVYLLKQCENAAALINWQIINIDTILKGFLILQTVKHYSKTLFPHIYYNALRQLAYCYSYHQNHSWYGLTARENFVIIENIFDELVEAEADVFIRPLEWRDMVINLLEFKEDRKTQKAIWLLRKIFDNRLIKKTSILYRYRGNTHKYFKRFKTAIEDYEIGLRLSNPKEYKRFHNYLNGHSSLLNNMAILICDCIEQGIKLTGYSLNDCIRYYNEIKNLYPDFKYLSELKSRIEALGCEL